MHFLHPEMLWGLLSLSIPIAVHLFNFRKQRVVYFPFTSFLREIKEETKQQSKIKHWIILALRLLAITMIVFAFAQPSLSSEINSSGKKNISIYIDNSFSMESQKDGISLLENAKNKALDIVFAHGENDNFQILANEFSGIQQHFVTKDKAIEIIQSIQPNSSSRKIIDVLKRQQDLIDKRSELPSFIYHISDFQKSHLTDFSLTENIKSPIRWIPVQNQETDNLYIDTVYFEIPYHSPSQEEILHVVLKNASKNPLQNIRCELTVNNQIKGVTSEEILGFESKEINFKFTSNGEGIQECKIAINDQPIVFDNNFYFTYWIEKERPIGIISNNKSNAQRVFQNDAHYPLNVQNIGNANLNQIIESSIIILENINDPSSGWISSIKSRVENGATLILIPPVQKHNSTWDNIYQEFEIGEGLKWSAQKGSAKKLDFNHPLFKNVFSQSDEFQLPESNGHLIGTWNSGISGVVFYPDGTPLLWSHKVGKGQIFGWNFDTENNSVFQHSLFPIAMIRCAELSGNQQPLYFTLGQNSPFIIQNLELKNEEQITLNHYQTQEKILPLVKTNNRQVSISIGQYISQSGIYRAVQNGEALYSIGVNFNNDESQLQFFDASELLDLAKNSSWVNISVIGEEIENLGTFVKKLEDENQIWWYLIVSAILLFIFESILTGIWKM